MRTGTATRLKYESGDFGTFSKLVVGPLEIYLGELPPRSDAHDLSCLPPMVDDPPVTYLYKYLYSNAHKKKNYRAVNMMLPDGTWGPMPDGRDACEIHSGNLMGDILLGFGAQVEGCGCPGCAIVVFPKGGAFSSFTKDSPENLVPINLMQDQPGVSSSVDALTAFESELKGEDLALTYVWA